MVKRNLKDRLNAAWNALERDGKRFVKDEADAFKSVVSMPGDMLNAAMGTPPNSRIPSLPQRPRRLKRKRGEDSLQPSVASSSPAVVAPLPLVGVELNPGPVKRGQKSKRKSVYRPVTAIRKRKVDRQMANMPGMSMQSTAAPVSIGYKTVMNNKLRNTLVTHCEQLYEVTAANSSTYVISNAFQINPGIPTVFPWLAQVAGSYETYEFKKLKFVFIPYTSSSTAGYVAMNFDYNPQEEGGSQFPTKQSFTDYDGAVQCNSWEAFEMVVKCPNLEGPRKRTIRTGALSGQYDLHNYDHGQFNIAVGGSSGSLALGTLYVCYTVALERPKISVLGSGATILGAGTGNITSGGKTSILGNAGNTLTVETGSTMGLYVGTLPGNLGSQNAQLVFSSATNGNFPLYTNNNYLISFQLQGTVIALANADTQFLATSGGYAIHSNGYWAVSQAADLLTGWGVVAMNGVAGTGDAITINFNTANITATSFVSYVIHIGQLPASIALYKPNPFSSSDVDYIRQLVKETAKLVIEEEQKDSEIVCVQPKLVEPTLSRQFAIHPDWDVRSNKSFGKR